MVPTVKQTNTKKRNTPQGLSELEYSIRGVNAPMIGLRNDLDRIMRQYSCFDDYFIEVDSKRGLDVQQDK